VTGPTFAWNDRLVREALGLAPAGEDNRPIRAVSTDSRAVSQDDLFVALRGERFDGHDFVADAVEKGCAGLVVDRPPTLPQGRERDVLVYRVPDTLVALGDLARFRRFRAQVEVVGITGSSGKTTVKDLTVAALSGFMNTHGTVGNLNNRIGVPLTILEMSADAAALVLEMGTNQPGEIAELARVAAPTVAVVTTVSETHVELLGDLAGVMAEKLDLVGP
jgi:UDP-N-acetylmuramoyl-tripeptide--D-alanyl-D-alanine ligase